MKLHSKKDLNYYYKFMFFSFIPLIIYGFIKNGILVSKETNNILIILKPVILFSINFALGMILDLFFNKKFINKYTFYLTLLFMVVSINIPIWGLLLCDIILVLLLKFDKNIFNKIAVVKGLSVLILLLLSKYSYGNIIELSGKYVFSFMDSIFKYQVGGICTSNLILVGVLIITLLFNVFYKKNISLLAILSFILTMILLTSFKQTHSFLSIITNSSILFDLAVIASLNEYSPYQYKGQIIFGALVGAITALISNYFVLAESVIITLIILSPTRLIFDKLMILDKK